MPRTLDFYFTKVLNVQAVFIGFKLAVIFYFEQQPIVS